jgi:hypothetical protein
MVTRFILNLAEEQALILPGRIPGYKRDDIKLLPSCETKASIWRRYKAASTAEQRVVGLSTFRKIWKQLLPFVIVAKPRADVCWECQKNNNFILRHINTPEDQKTAALRVQEEHLLRATQERSVYRDACQRAKTETAKYNIKGLGKNDPNSRDMKYHYSFDFAQQVHYPCNPFQPGPIYFKVPRKCGLFGINAEGLPAQINYLIDEGVTCGKGANVVISMLHHFFENYGVGEKHVHLNCDNCAGQNKNNYMLWYLCWRVASGLHTSIQLSFLIAGHTKFAPDWCFGLIKQRFRRTEISCLQDIVEVVNGSTLQGINKAQLIGDEMGQCFVKTYDWAAHLEKDFKKVVGIKKYHHFIFNSSDPLTVLCKEHNDSESVKISFGRKISLNMPKEIKPAGLDANRRAYLFKEIREFCTPQTQDLVCPKPEEEIEDAPVASTSQASTSVPGTSGKASGKGRKRKQ